MQLASAYLSAAAPTVAAALATALSCHDRISTSAWVRVFSCFNLIPPLLHMRVQLQHKSLADEALGQGWHWHLNSHLFRLAQPSARTLHQQLNASLCVKDAFLCLQQWQLCCIATPELCPYLPLPLQNGYCIDSTRAIDPGGEQYGIGGGCCC